MKRSRIIIGALVAGTAIGVAYNALSISMPRLKTIDRLVVNTSDDYFNIVHASEEEGIKQLEDLARSASVEEAWIYVPEEQIWYEAGYKQKTSETDDFLRSHGYGAGAKFNLEILADTLVRSESPVLYHIHPSRIAPDNPGLGIPSPHDFRHTLNIALALKSSDIKKTARHKVVSEYGVCEYSLTAEGFEHFKALGKDKMIETLMSKHFSIGNRLWSKSNESDVSKIIMELSKLLSDDYVHMVFTPFEH